MPRAVFLDTSYLLARLVVRDEHHPAARALGVAVQQTGTRLVTTRAVLFELGDAMARPPRRTAGQRTLATLEADRTVQIVDVTPERYAAARALYDARGDQSWGLTDCVSFVVMREFALTHALTADRHFEQAGFVALLRGSAA